MLNELFTKIIHLGYPGPCLEILIENLEKEDHPVLQVMIRNISALYNEAVGENVVHTLKRLINIFKTVMLILAMNNSFFSFFCILMLKSGNQWYFV